MTIINDHDFTNKLHCFWDRFIFCLFNQRILFKEILDYHQYVLNLTEANLKTDEPVWSKLYSFREAYNVPDMKPNTIATLVDYMAQFKTTADQYHR